MSIRTVIIQSVLGQTCQQAGSMCYRVTTQPTGLVGGSCCDSCLPYVPGGGTTWDGTTDWYCMYGSNGGAEGATCVSSALFYIWPNLLINIDTECLYWELCLWTHLLQWSLYIKQ